MSNSAGFRIRVDPELRQAFIDVCQAADQSAAQVLRAYMRRCVDEYAGGRPAEHIVSEARGVYVVEREFPHASQTRAKSNDK